MTLRSRPTIVRVSIAVFAAAALAACSCSTDEEPEAAPAAPVTFPSTTSTTLPSGPIAPLTGAPVAADSEVDLERPAMAVKIHNQLPALPQAGIQYTDVVYEELIASNVSRLIAIFHSQDSPLVGPIRSARTSDPPILANIETPGFAFSGANPGTLARVREADLISIGDTRPQMFRDPLRPPAPDNLMGSTDGLYELLGDRGATPQPIFTYLDSETDPAGEPTEAVDVKMSDDWHVQFVWDDEREEWLRWQFDRPHTETVDGGEYDGPVRQVGVDNVVVADVLYGTSTVDATTPEANPVGEGPVWLLSDGKLVAGTWKRPTLDDSWEFVAEDGSPLPLPPGRTWFVLARDGAVTPLTADEIAALAPLEPNQ